jgi:hypothetical protein
VRGVLRDAMFQGKGQTNFHYSQISRHFPLVRVVDVRLIKSNALRSEEGKVSGSGLCYEKSEEVGLRTQDAFWPAPRLTLCCLGTEPCSGS